MHLINKIKPVKRAFFSQNIINFANGNSADRPSFILKKFAGNNDFNLQESFLKILANFNQTFCYIEKTIFIDIACAR